MSVGSVSAGSSGVLAAQHANKHKAPKVKTKAFVAAQPKVDNKPVAEGKGTKIDAKA